MAYQWYDAFGYLGGGPTAAGWRDLVSRLRGSASAELAEQGHTEQVAAFLEELDHLLSDDPDVIETRDAVREIASKARELLILSDGVGLEV